MRIRRQDITLLAQAIAIVLPVVTLSGVVLHFLREDRAAIEHEAVTRAQAYLPGEVAALQQQVKNGIDHAAAAAIVRNGSVSVVGDYPRTPEPGWSEALMVSELQILETSNRADVAGRAVAIANRAPVTYRMPSGVPIRVRAVEIALRHSNGGSVPPNVLNALQSAVREYPDRAAGLLRLAAHVSTGPSAGRVTVIRQIIHSPDARKHRETVPRIDAYAALQQLEAEERQHAPDLVARSVEVASRSWNSFTPAGAPIGALALLIGLRHTENGVLPPRLFDVLHDQVERYPSFLTPELLKAAGEAAKGESAARLSTIAGDWRAAEDAREQRRALIRSVMPQLIGLGQTAAILPDGPRSEWLALCDRLYDGWNVKVIDNLKPRPPTAYLGLVVEIDRQRWRLAGAERPKATVLASRSGRFEGAASEHRYAVTIDLADPDQLYRPYRRGLLLSRSLIFCAALTALIGLASLWTSYRRQARLSEMKSNFVSSVTHELRAPLAAVRLMAESLDGGRIVEDGKRRDYYRTIVQECRRLSGLIENVLDFSRIGDGRKSYHFERVDLAALLRQSVAVMEVCAAERQVTLRVAADGAASLEPCWDAAAVEQALVNLIDNAIKHSPSGSVVDIGVERAVGKVRLWVEDSGPGIPAREQKRIFELFYRHGAELRRETKGAGIGLAIVRSVAEAHGGCAVVDSEVGHGSRFSLELPVERPS